MPEVPSLEREFSGEFSNEDVFDWLRETLEANKHLAPKGIAVSNRLHQQGIAGEFNGVKIAMDPNLYPDDTVKVVFEEIA